MLEIGDCRQASTTFASDEVAARSSCQRIGSQPSAATADRSSLGGERFGWLSTGARSFSAVKVHPRS